jgi:hypothetical protein
MEKELSTGRKVVLKEMEYDDMDICKDVQKFGTMPDGSTVVYDFHKSMTTWIRKGLADGDFKDKINGKVPDSVLKELSDGEKIELVDLIKRYNLLGE